MSRPTLVVSSTFPQHAGDHRGLFLLRRWEAAAAASGERIIVLAPRSAWSRDDLETPLEIRRFAYAPRPLSSLTGRFGVLENIRERPWRALLLAPFTVALTRALRRAIAELEPRRVVAHFFLPCGWPTALVARRAQIPCELYGHGSDVDVCLRLPAALRRRLAGDLLAAQRVALPSAEKRARLCEALGLDAIPEHFVVETMAEVVVRCAAADGEGEAEGSREGVLFVGRLIRQKGVDDLLRAVAALGGAIPVEIAGDGPERPRLERLARALGVPARFHGFVEPDARDRLYRRAAVTCVPSRTLASGLSEGAPLVICEARAQGAPVVASAVGGIPELCADDPGAILVPPGDPQALAQALRRALAAGAGGAAPAGSRSAIPGVG